MHGTLFHRLALPCALLALPSLAIDQLDVSFSPPKNLAVKDVPQFIVLGFDDNRYLDGMKWVLEILEGKKNPPGKGNGATFDGQPIKAAFYYSTNAIEPDAGNPNDVAYKAELLSLWKKTVADGHEIANHTHTHETSNRHTVQQWTEEIKQCTRMLVEKLGIEAKEIWGFRTPYLDFARPTFDAIKETGLFYEATVTHQGDYNKRQHVWPYTLHKGFSGQTGGLGGTGPDWVYPGIWELPVYTSSYDASGHPPVTGFDSSILTQSFGDKFDVILKNGLDYRLADIGNRAPYTVGLHSDTYSAENESAKIHYDPRMSLELRKKALSGFIEYALTKPDVRFVTAKQLIQWLRDPVALGDVRPVRAEGKRRALVSDLVKVKGGSALVSLPFRGSYAVTLTTLKGEVAYSARHVNGSDHRATITLPLPAGVHVLKIAGAGISHGRLIARP